MMILASEWDRMCVETMRERAVSSFFFSLFFLIFSFFGRIEKKKSWPKEIANATDRDAFLRLRIFFLPLWILLLLLWIEEDEKIKNKVKKSEKLRGEREERNENLYILYSVEFTSAFKRFEGVKRYERKEKGGKGEKNNREIRRNFF